MTNNNNNSSSNATMTSGTTSASSSGPLVAPGLSSSQTNTNPLSASTGSAGGGSGGGGSGNHANSTTVVIDIGQYLSPPVIRNLSDKLYEKRKLGALEVEQFVRDAAQHKEKDKLYAVTQFLTENFCGSSNANLRKGGLIALAAVAIGLGPECSKFMERLVHPVLKCFVDQDSRVRYYACESMYNIAKVGRNHVLPFFNDLFDGLCKLSADPDLNVKNGAQLLDRLMKDIVTESAVFDIEKFIPLLKERIYVINPFVRQFLLGWVSVLDSVPDIDLLAYLPEFLDGLFLILSDKKKDIRREAENTLSEFLREIKASPKLASSTTFLGSIITILIPHCSSTEELARLTGIAWITELIHYGKESLLPFVAELVGTVLPSLSHEINEIQDEATKANASLLGLISSTEEDIGIEPLLNAITRQLVNECVPTRLAALRWALVLHYKFPEKLENSFMEELFPALLKTLSDPSDLVVRLDLEVMAKVSSNEKYFKQMMNSVMKLFSTDPQLLDTRGSLIIRQLALFISPEKIFRESAAILETEEDPEFASMMIQTLNIILLTSTEFFELRTNLKNISHSKESKDLFCVLYRSWCHNSAATLSLCLLAQAYKHSTNLILKFSELEVTVNFLVEIDKLVQLLESPIFTSLRLQLLEPQKNGELFKCLYGLLMLLPQSTAFHTLKTRLASVSTLGSLHLFPHSRVEEQQPPSSNDGIDFESLLAHFMTVQSKHEAYRRKSQLARETYLTWKGKK